MIQKKEKGAALIVVLTFLVLMGVIAATIVTISQKSARKSRIETDCTAASYIAEGAASRLIWLMIDDLQKNTNRVSLQRFGNSNTIRSKYLAIGRPVPIKYYNNYVNAQIFDMASGFNISGSDPRGALQGLLQAFIFQPDLNNDFKIFLNRLSDYVSSSMGRSPNGMNKSDYASMGLAPLPRNDPMQYRDEVLWIPGAGKFFVPNSLGMLTSLNIIPPQGMYFYANNPNFFSAPKLVIMALCKFTSQQTDDIIAGRERYLNDPTSSIYDYISTDNMIKLRQQFSFEDSTFYTLVINAATEKGAYSKRIIVSLRVALPSSNMIQYYEYLIP